MSERSPTDQTLIDLLLRYDLESFAKKIGYIDSITHELSDREAVDILN